MKKILFIEDESALQKAVTEVLIAEGYQVLSALDGEIGVALALREHPDLILLDLVLPKKDGFEVLAALKKDPGTVRTPVIILSNLGDVGDVERTVELGATTFLVKTNYKLEEVVKKVKNTLGD